MEEWMKFQQNMNAIINDLKMKIGQLANSLDPIDIEYEVEADSRVQQQAKTTPLPFPSRPLSTRKLETDVDLLKMFRRVEINILLLDAIKQVPKYAKFLKELCIHKRKKLKAGAEVEDPRIFSIPCTIGVCTFADGMLDLGALINVIPTSVYKCQNFGDLEPTGIVIQLANRSIVQPVVSELIFPADFYVLHMENETSRKGSTLILGRPFLIMARTKIDVYVGTLPMEFGDNLVLFNIFEAMKDPPKDHSLCSIDMIDDLVEEFTQLDSISSIAEEADFTNRTEVLDPSDSRNHVNSPDILMNIFYFFDLLDQHSPVIIANNLCQEQEEKLLKVLQQHKRAIEWKISDLPGINPSICTHRILMAEEARLIRQ
ncbi:hypothetical protein CR513_10806, partial [Mucuna pruriens]